MPRVSTSGPKRFWFEDLDVKNGPIQQQSRPPKRRPQRSEIDPRNATQTRSQEYPNTRVYYEAVPPPECWPNPLFVPLHISHLTSEVLQILHRSSVLFNSSRNGYNQCLLISGRTSHTKIPFLSIYHLDSHFLGFVRSNFHHEAYIVGHESILCGKYFGDGVFQVLDAVVLHGVNMDSMDEEKRIWELRHWMNECVFDTVPECGICVAPAISVILASE